jgi:hypothetical protein
VGVTNPAQPLRVVGRNQEGTLLFVVDRAGNRFELPIDTTLRSALGNSVSTPTSATPDTTSTAKPAAHLRLATLTEVPTPREIQTLVRGGASIAEIAERSGLSEEKIDRYAGPILRERFHIAQQALGTVIRRASSEGAELGSVVAARLTSRGVASDEMEWDSWRRDDGKWTIVLTYPSSGGVQHAHWVLDNVRRTLTAEDESARWLTGDERSSAEKIATRLEEIAPQLPVAKEPLPERPVIEIARLTAVRDSEPAMEELDLEKEARPEPRKESGRGRTHVPAWDEIMFGTKKDADPFE